MKTYECMICGSNNVLRDAMAEWDWDKQEWVLASVFEDAAYCSDCKEETVIREKDDRIIARSAARDSFPHRYTVQSKAKAGNWYDVLNANAEEFALTHAEYLTKKHGTEHRVLDNWS